MKLRRLWIENYHILQDVTIPFEKSSLLNYKTNMHYFIGLNGSGKSTALEAIGLIFSHLAIDVKPGLNFELEYDKEKEKFLITTRFDELDINPLNPIGVAIFIRFSEEEEWKPIDNWESYKDKVLPDRIVGYSTGPTSNLHWALSHSVERYVAHEMGQFELEKIPNFLTLKEWEKQRQMYIEEAERRKFIYLDNPRTLFLSSNDAMCAVLPLLLNKNGIGQDSVKYQEERYKILSRVGLDCNEPIVAFSLCIKGEWYEKMTKSRRRVLEDLLQYATVKMAIEPDIDQVQKGEKLSTRDFYAVFEVDHEFWNQKIPMFTPLHFFEELLAWKRQEGIKSIHLFVKRQSISEILTEDSFSDGEYLVLGRFALLLMLRQVSHTLILLDEPETYLNDRWKQDLVHDLFKLLDSGRVDLDSTSEHEVIIATHSAVTISDAAAEAVIVFKNDGERITIDSPSIRTFGADIANLSEELADQATTVGYFSEEYLKAYLKKYCKNPKKLMEILDLIGPGALKVDFIEAVRRARKNAF
ncbi:AAA family ATPase [Peribacillus frigoritolerans]|uniref:AAA family ATPase n=1 Tax=Peribacillus frigoritolerans TaxID=450367 RepID=UPI0034E05B48